MNSNGKSGFISHLLKDLTADERIFGILVGLVAIFAVKFAVQFLRLYVAKLYSEKCRRRWVFLVVEKYFYASISNLKKKKMGTLAYN